MRPASPIRGRPRKGDRVAAGRAMPASARRGSRWLALEHPVDQSANLIAHELGHYLNLGHVSDTYAMMNPIIYARSVNLYASQCSTARSAARYYWRDMML